MVGITGTKHRGKVADLIYSRYDTVRAFVQGYQQPDEYITEAMINNWFKRDTIPRDHLTRIAKHFKKPVESLI